MTHNQPESPLHDWLRRLWPYYCLLTALATFGYALWDGYQIDGDAVSYMDIADLIRSHHWAGVVNAYWHPIYPAALALGQIIFHPTRFTELHAYFVVNFGIFLLEMLAVVAFTDAIVGLRDICTAGSDACKTPFLLDRYTLRYFGLALLVIASQRELTIGKVRPDALLQALLLFGVAALLRHLATAKLRYAAFMGLALGLAYLTKSFALIFTLLAISALMVFRSVWLQHAPARIAAAGAVALVCFGIVAGPYIAALSHQKGRLDLGDSGGLNYAWLIDGTDREHLQNGHPEQYGTAEVRLKHPEKALMTSPLVLSYKELPYGTYPDWFDPSYWNDQVKPHFNLHGEAHAITFNIKITFRFLLNHPETLVLFAVFLLLGARPDLCHRLTGNGFWIVPLLLGIAIWAIYGLVIVEERYVTTGFLLIALTLFAALRPSSTSRATQLASTASVIALLTALFATGETLRTVLNMRRYLLADGYSRGWYDPETFAAAQGLKDLGLSSGDAIACVGTRACLYDHYWARLADVRILTEIYQPDPPLYASLTALPNLNQAIVAARQNGAKVLVGYFDPGTMAGETPLTAGWIRLGNSPFYALPLNL
jgi:hypothetical protein